MECDGNGYSTEFSPRNPQRSKLYPHLQHLDLGSGSSKEAFVELVVDETDAEVDVENFERNSQKRSDILHFQWEEKRRRR